MKTNSTSIIIVLLAILIPLGSMGQKNVTRLLELEKKYKIQYEQEKQEAIEFAKENNLPISKVTSDGNYIEIVRIVNGIAWYNATENKGAAITTRANTLWPNGLLNLKLDGSGYDKLGEWDGGGVLITHQEFNNTGVSRVTQMDAAGSTHYHATHVAGTMIAGGVNNRAKGMAYNATLKAYEWNNDNSEMAAAAANGLEISSSYLYRKVADSMFRMYSKYFSSFSLLIVLIS